ncbi:uncharacterized protein LAJ45_09788 [Morchella importuna]|uniref:uncharacterized protein n=1 Tax=Morchella importuna TaxID=1174673 RepID=UPI001E8EB4CE|nr:uncharacterized protein LAJ45_09788 [Morchella importuna]KAH8146098.1 hypothetical protein LAJ45_09788 [Morchella importuna]
MYSGMADGLCEGASLFGRVSQLLFLWAFLGLIFRIPPCTLGDAIIRPQGSCTPLLTGVLNRRDYIDLPARSRNSISNFQPSQTPFIMLHHRRRDCIHHHTPLSHYVQHLVCLPRSKE